MERVAHADAPITMLKERAANFGLALLCFAAALYFGQRLPEIPAPTVESPMRLYYITIGLTLLCFGLLVRMRQYNLGLVQAVIIAIVILQSI